MNKRILLLSLLVLAAVGATLYWYWVRVPQPTVKLEVSDLGALVKITDRQGNDISKEPLVDGYTIVYERETEPNVWQPKAFNVVGNKASEKVSFERPKAKQLDTNVSVVVTTEDLKIINSFFLKKVAGKDQLHTSRAVEPLPGKKIRGSSVLTYSTAPPLRDLLDAGGRKLETIVVSRAVHNETCWPCLEPPCPELTTGQPGEERITCVVCPSDFEPRLFPAQKSELLSRSEPGALRGAVARALVEAELVRLGKNDFCRLPGMGIFPYALPTAARGVGIGRAEENRNQVLLACTQCLGDLPEHPRYREPRAFDMHRLNSDESLNFEAWLSHLPVGEKCLYPIRFNVWDRTTGRGEFEVWPFVILERREISR